MKAACSIVAALVLSGCANAAVRAAEEGDRTRLRNEIASKHERGALSNDEAASIARAVASRELEAAKDEASALARLHETRACTRDLDDAFEARMKVHDGAGAEAALALFEDKKLSEAAARDYLDDADDRWRAVGTRTLHREEDAKRRRAAMLDPSARVRRSALRASGEAQDPGDFDVLFETARVDPELLLRNEALRAMSAVARGDEGRKRAAELATRLRDLYTSGDDAIREDVAVAWALSPVFENGGRAALRTLIAGGAGSGALAGAGVVLRTNANDAELSESAHALLARTIASGSRRDRLHAIAITKASGRELDALRTAAKDDDLDIRVPALSRLLESVPDRAGTVRKLEIVAGDKDARLREHVERARLALASVGHLRIQAWIEEDLKASEAGRRTFAASALAALGRSARAAPLLADPDPSVRTRVACTILVSAR